MDLLLELQAEQSRMPVARPRSLESTALGAATIAGLAEGVWASLDELAGLWEAETVFEPSCPCESTDAVHDVWRRAVERSEGWAAAETERQLGLTGLDRRQRSRCDEIKQGNPCYIDPEERTPTARKGGQP